MTAHDVARYYLESASPDELARLDALRDEQGGLPIDVVPTGEPQLDEGIRVIFEDQAHFRARRAAERRAFGWDA
ncbi:hypothetical protein EPN42_10855 [bacterium]|nr:MAG: hypothetical protein EPN42_10855 [bacterium]